MAEVKEMEKLPEGWKIVRLGDVANFYKGRIYLKSDSTDKGKYEFIHYGELFTTYKEHIKKIISRINRNQGAFLSKTNDVLMPTSDVTPTGLATASCIKKDGIILGSDILVIRCFNEIEGIFLSYVIRLNKSKILQLIKGTTVYHLYASDLKNFLFFVPSLPEQRKIVEILKTVDNAIEKTSRIIEKYKRIKQGLMQDLLTNGIDENGQIRSEETHRFKDSSLGSIPEEWEVLELGEVFKLKSGMTRPCDTSEFGNYPVYGGNGILGYTNEKNFNIETIIIGRVGEYCGSVYIASGGWVTDNALYVAVKKRVYNNLFLCYLLNYINLNQYSAETGQPLMTQSIVYRIQIPLPPLTEQHRIVSILSQIDEAIEKEKRYKEKLERIKQGLMEDLLTGKVRVNHLIEGVENVSQT